VTTGKAVESITARADALAGRQLATHRRAPAADRLSPSAAGRARIWYDALRGPESSTVAATAYAQVGPRARVVEVDDFGNASSGTCMARSPQPPRATATQSSEGAALGEVDLKGPAEDGASAPPAGRPAAEGRS